MFFILSCLFIILPVLLSGITFIFLLKLLNNKFDIPLDMGLKWRGKRLFGKNKTIKGPLCMGFFTMLYGFLVYRLFGDNLEIHFSGFQVLFNFLLIGLAYSLGELPNSYFKRQLGIPPGGKHSKATLSYLFKIIDIFDSLLLVGAFYIILFHIQIGLVAITIIVGGMLHFLTDKLMVKLSLKQDFGNKRKD